MNDNDSVAQLCDELRAYDITPPPRGAWVTYANRIEEAHNREMNAKDAEIAKLRANIAKALKEIYAPKITKSTN